MKVPFNNQGHQMHRGDKYHNSPNIEWRDIESFVSRLKFEDMHKYSSYVVTLTDDSGCQYWMSNSEFIKAVPHMVNGVLEGKFIFRRTGKYYSVSCDGKP